MKRFITSIVVIFSAICMMAQSQGWPANYGGVMLQGFYWNSYDKSQWTKLEKQADDFAGYFDLVWIPQSGNCGGTSMGYDDLYWFDNYNSSFGTESQLRSMINTFKSKGIGTIADVVINHRRNVSSWFDFPKETYKGVTYEMTSTDICRNDDGGVTYTEAQKQNPPVSLSQNDDTGEDWDGMRDLDHKSTNVQNIVKAYLDMLLNDFGYAGFRYDMVKGYAATYTQMYNESAQPQFSVGECWDSSNTIKNWIEGTGKTSAAFDFQFKYVVRNAANSGDWSKLAAQNDSNWPLIYNEYEKLTQSSYKQWAVTFVENHDTEVRPDGSSKGPLEKDILAANAYMLAMPGTPCVFYKHYLQYPMEIRQMIEVRKLAGITNTSTYSNHKKEMNTYANYVRTDGTLRLAVAVGSGASSYTPNVDYLVKVLSGTNYALFVSKAVEKAFVDRPSGEYEGAFEVNAYALSNNANAELVYTTDGSNPTASSTKVSGGKIPVTQNCTLKVGLLKDGVVSAIVTKQYTILSADPKTITVYVNKDEAGAAWDATSMNFHSWGRKSGAATSWPGDAITSTTTVGGKTWYYKEYTLEGGKDIINFVFNVGTGSPQTVNVEEVKDDAYFIISADQIGSNYAVNDVTAQYSTGIEAIAVDTKTSETNSKVYTLDGRLLNTTGSLDGLRKGIYIVGGKKVIK